MRSRFLQSAVVVTTLSLAGVASAHFQLKAPLPSLAGDLDGKGNAPCGPDGPPNAPMTVITSVTGGSQIAVTVNETVFHPGHYRIALSINSRDEIDPSKPGGLKEPVVKNAQGMPITTGNSFSADIQNPPVFPVLADGIFAHTADANADFTQMITLPNVNCERCTLQVIEFMAEHTPSYFYRHCADLKITADTTKPIFNPGGAGGAGGSGAGGSAGLGGSSAGGTSTGGAPTAGAPSGSGGTPGSGGTGVVSGGTGSAFGGSPGAGGAPATTAGTGTVPVASTADESGCSVSAPGRADGTFYALLVGLALGLGRLGRRRQRAS